MESKSSGAQEILSPASTTVGKSLPNNFDQNAKKDNLDPVWDVLSDKYQIHKVLGSGSFGTVVSATHI